MTLAGRIFTGAGIYGLLILVPGLFTEGRFNALNPPPITHPEFYYGFYGSAIVWQLLFLLIGRDPARFRILMPLAMLEKAAFFIPCLWLWAVGRMGMTETFFGGMIDGVLLLLFGVAWRRVDVTAKSEL
ncbi:MAG: hypothetical protein IPN84_09290 [Sphingomonadales bacterium]|nr:hypothetical protein [Sphingomonadales bacterium]